ncbi:MAG: hypothetical protein H7Y28_04365 [Rhodoferax sp.]|nr:hypothetical protein [Rhodoferax sp.]
MELQTLVLIVGAVISLGVALYLYLEHQARTVRTRIVDVPGGLRFEAHGFSIEVQRSSKQLAVVARTGRLVRTPLDGGEIQTQLAPFNIHLPAAGLQIEVLKATTQDTPNEGTLIPAGFCTIRLRGTDAPSLPPTAADVYRSELCIERVPEIVIVSFNNFAARVRVWIEKIDRRLELERVARARKEEETAQAAEVERLLAEAQANKPSEEPLTDSAREALIALQLSTWRKAAGFTGAASEVSADAQGRVDWFVDVMDDGRITLHADKRTIHSTLQGADIASRGGELEIGVRDDYWTEDEPALRIFRVFKGLSPDARRAWKERLELVRDNVTRTAKRGP